MLQSEMVRNMHMLLAADVVSVHAIGSSLEPFRDRSIQMAAIAEPLARPAKRKMYSYLCITSKQKMKRKIKDHPIVPSYRDHSDALLSRQMPALNDSLHSRLLRTRGHRFPIEINSRYNCTLLPIEGGCGHDTRLPRF